MDKGMNKRQMGAVYEEKAAEHIRQQGFLVLVRNYRCKIGEIDIIAKDGVYLVFLEVKYRMDHQKGGPLEAVDRKKQRTISKVAQYYCMTQGYLETVPCRFDVAAFEGESLTYIRNAFDFID